ncbi:MAG: DUF4397 domain-containing protein [Bryobacteraceae bacterium]|nr:DUF4397 domain-containing protein [Bryobacteraceae bacterium]
MVLATAFAIAGCGTARQTEEASKSTAGGAASTAPSSESAAKRDKALVRFINADPMLSSADLWFGDQAAFSGIAYKTVTPYQELPGERRIFSLRASGKTDSMANNSEGLGDGDRHSIVAVRKDDGSLALLALNDNLVQPDAGRARIRVIHAAPSFGELRLTVPGLREALFDGVDFNSGSDYKTVDPAAAVEIRRENEDRAALRIANANIQAGKTYTFVITGGKKAGQLDYIRIEDELVGSTAAR